MSVANRIHDHQANCLVPLISLQMLAQGEAGTPLPRWVVVEVAQATSTVLAEAEAAGHAILSVVGVPSDHPEAWRHSSESGWTGWRPQPTMRSPRHGREIPARCVSDLRRFDALTSAIWTVQDGVYGSRRASAAS